MSEPSKTPRTDFVSHESGDSEWNRSINRFGRMQSHAQILETDLAAANKSRDDWCELVNQLRAEVKRLREPMPEQVCNDLIDEWLDKDPKWVDLIRRVEAWHANK